MAKHRKKPADLRSLIDRSERARATLADARVELRNRFDVVGRIRESLASPPIKVIGGGLAAGYLVSKLFSGRKNRRPVPTEVSHLKTERGFLLGILALLAGLAKPAARMYASKLAKDYLSRRFLTGAAAKSTALRVPPN